jgi:phosphatidate cytidylyltransferase
MTGLVLGVAVMATILFLPTPQAGAVLGLLWLAGAWEWAGLARGSARARAVYAGAFALAMIGLLRFDATLGFIDPLLIVALAGWCVALAGVLTYPRRILPAFVWAAGPLALLPAWLVLVAVHTREPQGPVLALLVLALVWAADVGAYATGRTLGRVKLAPKVSPGKTWEGVSGGVLFALIVAWAASPWLGLPVLALLAIAAVTALVSVVGDLTVSMLKRNVGLKDSGRLLPGHGGVMDRIDGLIAAVPVYAAGLRLAGLLS